MMASAAGQAWRDAALASSSCSEQADDDDGHLEAWRDAAMTSASSSCSEQADDGHLEAWRDAAMTSASSSEEQARPCAAMEVPRDVQFRGELGHDADQQPAPGGGELGHELALVVEPAPGGGELGHDAGQQPLAAVVGEDPHALRAQLQLFRSPDGCSVQEAYIAALQLFGSIKPGRSDLQMQKAVKDIMLRNLPIGSRRSRAAALGITDHTLKRATVLGASAMVELGCLQLEDIMLQLVNELGDCPDGRLISITEVSRYDETPMVARVLSSVPLDLSLFDDVRPEPEAVSSADASAGGMHVTEFSIDTAPAKLLQSELTFVLLYRMAGKYTCLKMRVPVRVQSLQRTTGECVLQALREHTPGLLSHPGLPHVTRKQRLVVTDRGGGMLRAERAWRERREDVVVLQHTCDIHRCSAIRDKAMTSMESNISGLIHLALSMREAGSVASFRKAMRTVILKRLKIHTGRPPRACQEHHRRVLGIFIASGTPSERIRVFVITSLANGDWSDPEFIHHWCFEGCPCGGNPRRCKFLFCTAFTSAVLPCAVLEFPRNRWTRGEETVSAAAMLMVVNNLGTIAFKVWCGLKSSKAGAQHPAALAAAAQEPEDAALPDGDVMVDGDDGVRDMADGLNDLMGVPPDEAAGSGSANAESYREEASRHRRIAGQWIQDGAVLGDLMVMRIMMEPQRQYMSAMLHRGGDEFERARTLSMAKDESVLTHLDPDDYRCLTACTMKLELEFCKSTWSALSTPDVWACLPSAYPTVAKVSRCFQMGSVGLCSVKAMMILRYRQYPFKTFRILMDDSYIDTVDGDCDKLKDPWTLDLQRVYGRLEGADARAEIMAMVATFVLDTSQIEARHASLRRYLEVRKQQTHSATVEELSAEFCARLVRVRAEEEMTQAELLARRGSADAAAGQPGIAQALPRRSTKRRRVHSQQALATQVRSGGGGAWRAYIHSVVRGTRGKPDWNQISQKYRALSEEERAVYARMGQLAMQAHKEGVHAPFGPKPELLRVRQRRDNLILLAKQMNQRALQPGDFGTADLCGIVAPKSAGDWLSTPRQLAWAQSTLKAVASRSDEQLVQEWLTAEATTAHLSESLTIAPIATRRGVEPLALRGTSMLGARLCDLPRVVDVAAKVVASLRPNAPTVQLGEHIRKSSMHAHRVIMHDECEQLGAVSNKRTTCERYGSCVCKGVGLKVLTVMHAFDKALKGLCPESSEARKFLMQGSIVARLLSKIPGGPGGAGDGDDFDTIEHWWHLGYLIMNPWDWSSHVLVRMEDPLEPPLPGHVVLEGTAETDTEFEALSRLDRRRPWELEVWQLSNSAAPVADFLPTRPWVKQLVARAIRFWPPTSRRDGLVGSWANRLQQELEETTSEEEENEDDKEDACVEEHAEIAEDLEEGCEVGILVDAWAGAGASGEDDFDGDQGAGGEDDFVASGDGDFVANGEDAGVDAIAELFEDVDDLPPEVDGAPLAPLAAAAAPHAGAEHVERLPGLPTITVEFAGGTVKFFGSNGNFQAHCKAPGHGPRCTQTRNAIIAGRHRLPLGYLAAWLLDSIAHADKGHHTAVKVISHERRADARATLLHSPGSALLFQHEKRVGHEGDVEEPEVQM